MVMELLVFAIALVLFAVLKRRLSVDKPGKLQHIFEVVYKFLLDTANEVDVHKPGRFVAYFGTLFIFILFCNLIGVIPTFESPTMFPMVPAGLALATFAYYNYAGMREHGPLKYMAHFAGPMPALAPLMFPIELVSHMARPLSLTIRLFANMFAGEQVTLAFLKLTLRFRTGPFHGSARFCFASAGLYFYAAHDDLRGQRGRSRTLNTALSALQCERGGLPRHAVEPPPGGDFIERRRRMKVKLLVLLAILFIAASPIFAQATGTAPAAANNWKPAAAAIGMAIASGLCGLAQGKAVAGSAEAMARNPGAMRGNPVCADSRPGSDRVARTVHPRYHLHDLASW